ncbi:hypothetical protein MAR_027734 [Mya arenaria]|uniref:Uncharacterized protein n=1 Tax=Mya arenaria TaxID=6604 RepID=A0ABY7EX59_MYAAR|nr:hypothetical protein MAR_027734 [Mya arenaria]
MQLQLNQCVQHQTSDGNSMKITRSQQNNRLKGRLSGTASDMCYMYNSIRKCQEMERDGSYS